MTFKARNIFAVSISIITLTWATTASADSPKLKGSYGFTGTAACLAAPGHAGDPNGAPLNNPTPGVALANSASSLTCDPTTPCPGLPVSLTAAHFPLKEYARSTATARAP
jgi:hypothetical protein